MMQDIGRSARILLTGLLVAVPLSIQAQTADSSRRGPWEIAPFIGTWDDSGEFGPGERDTFVDPEKGVLIGTHFGYHWSTGFFLESEFALVPIEMGLSDGSRNDLDLLMFGGSLGYDIPISDAFELFVSAGAGASRWSPDGFDSETDIAMNLGTGARWFLADNFALRFDAKMRRTSSALEGTTAALGESFPGEAMTAWTLGVGAAFRLGGGMDSDGDGVNDSSDACPDTPRGVRVDDMGCPLDTDGDGVADHMDDCPNTPRGTEVDARGCPVPEPVVVAAPPVVRPPVVRPEPEPAAEPEPIEVEDVHFAVDSSELDATARGILDRAGRLLRRRQNVTIELSGHTDSTASEIYNQGLSERRARAVMEYLSSNFGVAASRFDVQSFGETRPTGDNGSDEGRRRNRRVEIRIQG